MKGYVNDSRQELHNKLKYWVKEKYQSMGYNVIIEKVIRQPKEAKRILFIDVFAQKDGHKVGIECKSDYVEKDYCAYRHKEIGRYVDLVVFAFPKNIITFNLEKEGVNILHVPIVNPKYGYEPIDISVSVRVKSGRKTIVL